MTIKIIDDEFRTQTLIRRIDIQKTFLQKKKTKSMYSLQKNHNINPIKLGRDVYWTRSDLVRMVSEGFMDVCE